MEIARAFEDPHWSRFPPLLTVAEAAELLRVPKATIYAWSSQGRLANCSKRAGKRLLILRDRLLKAIFNTD